MNEEDEDCKSEIDLNEKLKEMNDPK